LEADNVFILGRTLYPKRKSDENKTPEQIAKRRREEANLEYVAQTRAKHRLTIAEG
jgi:superfamily I DNA/RNA helicase